MNNQSKRRNLKDVSLLILVLCITALFSIADEKPKAIEAVKPVHAVAITPALAEAYATADAKVIAARRAVESNPVWKDYIIAQNQQQTVLVAIMAEVGLKPSEMADPGPPVREGCRAVIEDGKLMRFDCPIKDSAKKP